MALEIYAQRYNLVEMTSSIHGIISSGGQPFIPKGKPKGRAWKPKAVLFNFVTFKEKKGNRNHILETQVGWVFFFGSFLLRLVQYFFEGGHNCLML